MATNDRKDPYRNFRFKVECDGLQGASFSDVSGYDMSVNMAEYRNGDDETTTRKLPGLRKYSNITLKRGVTDDMAFYKWVSQALDKGKIERKSVTITLLDEEKADSASWQVVNAWPVKYSISEFKGTGNEVLIETLELAHEGMTRKK